MIDWFAFLVVFVASLVSAVFVVVMYSLGIRFLAVPSAPARGADGRVQSVGPDRDDEDDDIDDAGRPMWATIAANFCFGVSVIAVLAGIYLIVPALHG